MLNMKDELCNVSTMVAYRQWNTEKGNYGKEMLFVAEEKAASCDMEEISCQLPENTRSTFLVAFSPDGTKVASAHGNHKIYVCDVRTGKCLHTLEGHPRTPWCLAFHPSYNDILASGCLGGEVRVWDLHGGCEVWDGEGSSAIASLAFHPTDQVLVIATANMLYFWDWSKSQPFAWCKTATERERVRFVRFDAYGHRLFTGIANISAVYKHRDELGRSITTREREQEQNSLRERLLMLYEQHRQLLAQLQELQIRAEASMEEVSNSADRSADVFLNDSSSSYADALQRAQEYAADVTSRRDNSVGNNGANLQSSFSQTESRETVNIPNSTSNSAQEQPHFERPSSAVEQTPRMSFHELQEDLHSMRVRYSRICERLRELLTIHSRNAEESADGGASDANLVYSLLTFWREYETLAISLQHTSLQYNADREPNRDARRHIAVAMVYLLQLQEMLQTNIMHHTVEASERRGMAHLIHSILMTLLELATLDTNILALRTTALEAIGRTVQAQLGSSLSRPESRRQSFSISRSQPTSLSAPSTSTAASTPPPTFPRVNPRSWHSVAGSSLLSHEVRQRSVRALNVDEALANSDREQTDLHLSMAREMLEHRQSAFEPHNAAADNRFDRSDSFVGASGMDVVDDVSSNDAVAAAQARRENYLQPQNRRSLSNTEQLIRSILEELLSLLASTSSSNSRSSFSAASGSPNVIRPSPSFPASWYPYWWSHLWNIRSAGLSEPILVTRPTYRIQCWDFTKFRLPDISNAQAHIIVPECLIQNDASIEVSRDGRFIATLVPSSIPTSTLLAVHSLLADTFGQCLYLWSFVSSVISISLSPLGKYALVGLGSNRRPMVEQGSKLVIGQVLQLVEGKDEKEDYLQHVRTVELQGENQFDVSLNSMRWLPLSGEGLVYGTNKGDLKICRPRASGGSCTRRQLPQKLSDSSRQLYRDIVARVLVRRSSTAGIPRLPHLAFPATNTTGTQTDLDEGHR